MQQPGNMRPQRFAFATGNNPSVAAHDGDPSNLTSVKRQEQWASDADCNSPAKSVHYMPDFGWRSGLPLRLLVYFHRGFSR
jgi:hypothetical protein